MTALRWFLSYLLPMLLVSSLATAYFYREQLTNNWYRTLTWPVAQINAVLQQQIQLSIVEPAVASVAIDIDSENKSASKLKKENIIVTNTVQALDNSIESQNKINFETNNDKDSKTDPLEKPVAPETPKMPILPAITEMVELDATEKKSGTSEKLAVAPQGQQHYMPYPHKRMMPPVQRPLVPVFNLPKPATHFKLNKKHLALLHKARKAYWTRDFKTAKKQYLALIKKLPDNPDIQGELGNLFFLEHKLESAIKHYTLAAKLLVKHRHYWKLPGIMQIVSKFNPEKSIEIMHLIQNQYNAVPNNNSLNNKGY